MKSCKGFTIYYNTIYYNTLNCNYAIITKLNNFIVQFGKNPIFHALHCNTEIR